MGWRNGNSSFLAKANREAQPYVEPSNVFEVFGASVEDTIMESTSTGMLLNRPLYNVRNDSIKKAQDDGRLPPGYMDKFIYNQRGKGYGYLYRTMAEDIKKNYPELSINTDEELIVERNADMAAKREDRMDIISRGKGVPAAAAQFAGGMVGMMASPEGLAMAVVAPATVGVKGLSRAAYTMSVTSKGAAVGAIGAASVEPFIYAWKQEIGSDYTTKDAMFNIAASGLMNGTIDGLAGSLLYGFKVRNLKSKDAFEKRVAEKVERDLRKESVEAEADQMDTVFMQSMLDDSIDSTYAPAPTPRRPGSKLSDEDPYANYGDFVEKQESFMELGLDNDDAAFMANLVQTAEVSPEPKLSREEYFTKMEDTRGVMEKSRISEDITSEKVDILDDVDIDEFEGSDLKEFSEEGGTTYRDSAVKIKEDLESLQRFAECIIDGQ